MFGSADPLATRPPGASASTDWMATREPLAGAGVARVRIPKADGSALGFVGAAAATVVFASGGPGGTPALASCAGTETATGLDIAGCPLSAFAAKERLWSPGASAGGMMTNWPAASAVASATVLPPSRSSTFSFGAARPAMTASPEGSTFTTSKAGSRAAVWVGAFRQEPELLPGERGGAGGTIGGLGSTGAPGHKRNIGGIRLKKIRISPNHGARSCGHDHKGGCSDPNQRVPRRHTSLAFPLNIYCRAALRQISNAEAAINSRRIP